MVKDEALKRAKDYMEKGCKFCSGTVAYVLGMNAAEDSNEDLWKGLIDSMSADRESEGGASPKPPCWPMLSDGTPLMIGYLLESDMWVNEGDADGRCWYVTSVVVGKDGFVVLAEGGNEIVSKIVLQKGERVKVV